MTKLKGIGASQGIAIGKIFMVKSSKFCVLKHEIKKTEIAQEIKRFEHAIDQSKKQLSKIKEKARKDLDPKYLYVIDAHLMILQDDLIANKAIERTKKEKVNIDWALQKSIQDLKEIFLKSEDEYLRDRERDIYHVGNLILGNLIGQSHEAFPNINEKSVVVAHDLSPSDIIQMKKDKVLGFITETGGKTSHLSIMATSLEIPAVIGLKGILMEASFGEPIIIDGEEGLVIINPSKEQFQKYLKKHQRYKYFEKELLKLRTLKAETRDGFSLKLMANIETNQEIPLAQKQGAEGIGLFRTEYLFLNRQNHPTEDEQFQFYKEAVESFAPHPVIIRTLDIGGDKAGSGTNFKEANPALGMRAIRYCLSQVDIFKTQLRGIVRASHYGYLKIMYPMISGQEEIQKANEILEEVKEDLSSEGTPFNKNIEIGIMIETPSAALIANILANMVDFFSIGTNDLIQYVLAIDRTNEMIAHMYQPLHPSILKLIQSILSSAEKAGIGVSVCGEMGGDPLSALVLLGLGKIESLSMDTHSIPKIKKMIRNITMKDVRDITNQILTLSSSQEINGFINSEVVKHLPKGFKIWN